MHFERKEAEIYNNDSLQDLKRIEEMRRHVIALSNASEDNQPHPDGLVSLKHIINQKVDDTDAKADKVESYVMLNNSFDGDTGNADIDRTFIVKRIHLIFNDR